jgi:hypothetical protein
LDQNFRDPFNSVVCLCQNFLSYCSVGDVTKVYSVDLVTDGMEGMCVDPGEMEADLQAGGVRGPSPPGGGKGGQLASDSGGA